MSIQDEINKHIESGTLHLMKALPNDPFERTMIISNCIKQLVDGPWQDTSIENRASRLRADLEAFVKGDPISVSLTPYEHKSAYMGRLDMPKDEVWDIRSRDPNPGLRVFGRFAEVDVFIAISWRPRSRDWGNQEALGGDWLTFELEKLEVEEKWRELFPGHSPIHGENINEYFSTDAFLV